MLQAPPLTSFKGSLTSIVDPMPGKATVIRDLRRQRAKAAGELQHLRRRLGGGQAEAERYMAASRRVSDLEARLMECHLGRVGAAGGSGEERRALRCRLRQVERDCRAQLSTRYEGVGMFRENVDLADMLCAERRQLRARLHGIAVGRRLERDAERTGFALVRCEDGEECQL